jgi:hypothetical protein
MKRSASTINHVIGGCAPLHPPYMLRTLPLQRGLIMQIPEYANDIENP